MRVRRGRRKGEGPGDPPVPSFMQMRDASPFRTLPRPPFHLGRRGEPGAHKLIVARNDLMGPVEDISHGPLCKLPSPSPLPPSPCHQPSLALQIALSRLLAALLSPGVCLPR